MKIKYIDKTKWGYLDAKEYYCKENKSTILIVDYDGIYQLIKLVENNNFVYETGLIEKIKFNKEKSFFEIKSLEFTDNTNILFCLYCNVNANGDIFDLKFEIPNIYKAKLNLDNCNIYEESYYKILGKISSIVEILDISTEQNEKNKKKEMKKYGN